MREDEKEQEGYYDYLKEVYESVNKDN